MVGGKAGKAIAIFDAFFRMVGMDFIMLLKIVKHI